MKQSTLAPAPPKIYSKKAIRSNGIKFYQSQSESFEGILDEIENIHNRTSFHVLASGGKDSTVVADKTANLGKLKTVVHIKTNIGLRMTTDHLRDYCKEMGWPLVIIEPAIKYIYAAFVLQCGFPGPGAHKQIMARLKAHVMRDYALSVDRKSHILLSGVRKFESKRRMGNYPYPIQTDGHVWFGCPAFYSKAKDIYKYVITNGLKLSPSYDFGFSTSGECLCGAYAARDEKMLIRKADPVQADYIQWLEVGVQKFGTPLAKRFPHWGRGPAMLDLEQQKVLDTFMGKPDKVSAFEGIICGTECGPGTMRGQNDY